MPQVRAAAQPTTLGHYTLIERIGLGGQAEVWRAHDESRGVDIALKVLAPSLARSPAAWEALEREHAVSGRLQHPGILQVLAPERVDDVVVLPMELAGGGDLRRLRGAGYLEIVPILLEVAEALEYAHARGVVHRDLKPGNVLLDSRGRVKVADFGIAALLPAPGGVAEDSRSAGHSPFSASPEQLRGEPPSVADDIYGLGALAYELLSGHPPYYPNFELRRALTQPVPQLAPTRQIPPELGELVMRMLAKSAAQRPASMQTVMDELDVTLNATLSFAPEGADASDAGGSAADALERHGSETLASPAPERPGSEASASPAQGPRVTEPEVEAAEAKAKEPEAKAREPEAKAREPEAKAREPEAKAREPEAKESRPLGSPTGEPQAPERLAGEPRTSPPRFAPPHRAPPHRAPPHRATVTPSPFRFDLRHQRGDTAARPAVARSTMAEPGLHSPDRETTEVPMTPGPAGAGVPARPPDVAATARPASPRPLAGVVTPTLVESAAPQPQPAEQPHLPEQPTHSFIPPAVSLSPDHVIDLESTEPRLRAVPAPGRRQSPPWAGSRRARRWPYLLSGLLCGAVLICGATAAALFWLPREDVARLQALLASIAPAVSQATSPAPAPEKPPSLASAAPPPKPPADPAALARLTSERADFDKRAAALAARGAAAWGGAEFAAAQMQAAESSGAAAAGGIPIALQRLSQAEHLLANVARKEPQALASQLRAGDAALAAGHQEQASQAYALARRIDPNSQRAIDGTRRARMLKGVLPLLADAQKAEAAHNYSRAAQDFSQALALDPGNDLAKAGLARANAAFGDDNYARALGAGFAALGAGRLTEAHADFQQALDLRPHGAEATDGLQRVSAAMTAGRVAALRRQAASLEAQERWSQAAAVYDKLLRENPSLGYAKRGKARDQERAQLTASLQQIIDHPDGLALPSVRDEAVNLLQEAREQMPSGPMLQSQVERLSELLPQLERPVQLNMVSDNATQVSIPSIGVFGSFGRREIRLKPGTYTVVGTRDGYRAVHQEFTVEPGQQSVTITVSCSEPI